VIQRKFVNSKHWQNTVGVFTNKDGAIVQCAARNKYDFNGTRYRIMIFDNVGIIEVSGRGDINEVDLTDGEIVENGPQIGWVEPLPEGVDSKEVAELDSPLTEA